MEGEVCTHKTPTLVDNCIVGTIPIFLPKDELYTVIR